MTPTTYQREHLKSLTGMRFLAAFMVFVAHVPARWPQFDIGSLPLGAAGVGFFYLLSGFILTYVYGLRIDETYVPKEQAGVENGSSRFAFGKFYLRRFARIWPLHFVTLLISLFVVLGVENFFNRPHAIGKLLANAGLLQSWIPNYDWIYSLNGPSWSLSVEAFFYLVFPFLLLGGEKKFVFKFIAILLGTIAALFAISAWVPTGDESWIRLNAIVHTNPLMRLLEFATGMGCGLFFLKRSRTADLNRNFWRDTQWEVLVLLAAVTFFAGASWMGLYAEKPQWGVPDAFWYWFRFCGAAPIFALVVLVFSQTRGGLANLFSSRVMVYLGEISYSFYMIHMGVMLVMVRQPWLDGWWVVFGVVAGCFAMSLFLAAGLYHLVELPFRRWIVGLSEGKKATSLLSLLLRALVDWIRTPAFIPILILALATVWFGSEYRFDFRDQGAMDTIVSKTPNDLRGVRFEEDAILQGVETVLNEDGSLNVALVWKLREGRRPVRFAKLLDEKSKSVGRGDPNRDLFENVLGNETVIDRFQIDADKMEGVSAIAIGFFDPERKTAKVDSGPRDRRNRQLYIWRR